MSTGGPRHAFILAPGGPMQQLMPADTESVAFDINDAGQVTGRMFIAQGTQARGFLWSPPPASPQLRILPVLTGGDQAEAFAINRSGEVVGTSQPQVGVNHAVLWDASGNIQDLGTLGGNFGEANDINDAGVVVGLSRNASNQYRAFRWSASTGMVPLPAPWGGFASANAINSAGQIVGELTVASGQIHAVLWDTTGAIVDLDSLGTSQSAARAITDDGLIAGTRFLSGGSHVFAWDPDTRAAVDVGSGDAADVNATGRIVGLLYPRATAWQVNLQADITIQLSLTDHDLRPRIRSQRSPNRALAFLDEDSIPPDTSKWTITVLNGQTPVANATVRLKGIYTGGGGHAHLSDTLRFEAAPDIQVGHPDGGLPVVGHFIVGTSHVDSVSVTATNGVVQGRFVGGHISGIIKLIASAVVNGTTVADTDFLQVRIPGLVPLMGGVNPITNANYTGWNAAHAYGNTWYLLPQYRDSLQRVLNDMAVIDTIDSTKNRFLGLNDASLPMGGRFEASSPFDPTPYPSGNVAPGHRLHTRGIDIDVRECMVDVPGDNNGGPKPACQQNVDLLILRQKAQLHGASVAPEINHYHIRFREN